MKPIFLFLLFLITSNLTFSQSKINGSTFGSMESRALGPGTMSGRITAIEGVNKDGKTIYVGTAGGGIWKSTNAGASFKSIFDKYCQSIGALAIDQLNSDVIYAGTGESNMRNSVSIGVGLYKSTDAGNNWVKIGLDSTEHISKIIIDPKNSNTLYVAVPGPLWNDSKHRGLYKSTDGGKSWNKILFINEKTGCADIAIDPMNPNIIYATTWEFRRKPYSFNSGGKGSGFYKSTDGGVTWKKIINGLPTGEFGRIALALAPSEPNNLIAIVESNNTGLFISSDYGESWKQQSATMNIVSRPFYFSTIVIDPKDAKRVYRPAFTFSYSDDRGYSFNDASNDGGWVHSDHHALWINPNNTNHMFLGTDGGVYISNDRGATFTFCQNLPVGQFYHVAIDHCHPYNIYGGLQDNGSWTAPSAKAGGIGNGDWKGIYWGDGFWTIPDLIDSTIAYAEYQGGNAARIDLKTNKSFSIQPQQTSSEDKLRWNWNTPLVKGNKNINNLYMGAQYLFISKDQGRNWTKISPDLTTNDPSKLKQEESGGLSADNTSAENHCTIFTISESPLDEKMICIGTDDGNIQMTPDAGINWYKLSDNFKNLNIPQQIWVSSIALSHFDKNTIYVTLDNHMYGDHNTYLMKSSDAGKSWEQIKNKEFTGFAHKIIEDPIHKNLLFLGTEMGLFCSLDAGLSWFRMKNNFPEFALVRDLQIHPTMNALIICTHGRGIFIYDDISIMRTMTQEILDKDVHLFSLNKMILTDGTFGGSNPFSGGWIAPNPDDLIPLQYYFKERPMNAEVKIEILDANKKVIKIIPASKRKGVNKVFWNMRINPPKVAEGGTKIDFGGFGSPQVLPGNYFIKLSVGAKEFVEPFEVVHIDQKGFNLEDRKLQYETSMKLYNMHENLAKTVEEINTTQIKIKELLPKITNSKYKKLLNLYFEELEKLRTTLLAAKQKSIFADEKKLREEISDCYGNVIASEQAPSNLSIERTKSLQIQVNQAQIDLDKIKTKYDKFFKIQQQKLELNNVTRS
ncbi:MAG: glycosyl hydrolase [Saprospiraceae bacterium]|nr:glycosyl hydrolase [Candidatus Defluviibacterium haderslevense]